MARFQYLVLEVDTEKKDLSDELTAAGDKGWRVVQVLTSISFRHIKVLVERSIGEAS